MKQKKIFRLLGMIALLSILMTAIPAAPVLAVGEAITLTQTLIKIGDRVDFTGTGYLVTTSDYYVDIYITDQPVAYGYTINTTITRYKRVVWGNPLNYDGTFAGYFVLNSTNIVLDEGSIGVTSPVTLTEGNTYTVCSTYVWTDPYNTNKQIRAFTNLTISPGASLDPLSPTSGQAGDTVTISGTNFPASTALVFQFDSATIQPTAGSTQTSSGGSFTSIISIPSSATAGTHTITVTAGSSTVEATFTVTASPALNAILPASGAPGTSVAISGANFKPSYPIIFKFDSTTLTPTGGDSYTTTSGGFASTIAIPSNATAGAHKIYVTVETVTVNADFTVEAAQESASLNPLSATSGSTGSDIIVSGANFPDGDIIITFDGNALDIQSGSNTQTTDGSFSSTITIPSGATVGTHTIAVTVGTITKSAQFTVTAPTSQAVLSINQSGNFVGAIIGIGGAGFTPNTDVTIMYDDIEVASMKTDAQGTFVTTFDAPPSKAGDHAITVSDGVNSAETTFNVESTAPKVPTPLKPALGAKVKSPMIFDWQEVTDDSRPVTYRLQIATDKSFRAGTIVVDKAGIEGSSYTLSELEELKLEVQETPYYWRIKSIDAASNESEWTGAGEFYVPGPFKFPSWGLYTIIVVGAIFFFLLGLWVGRRTAFYY